MTTTADLDLDPKPVAHLPLVRAVIDQLHIRDVLDDLLPADPRSRVSDAECVTVMLLNLLEGRVALYNMEQWLARTDIELILGEGCPGDAFNDARLAACLDHIADAGTEEVLSAVVKAYLSREDAERTYTVHQDTTSVSVYGAYEGAQHRAIPTYGFSKDHRPDLKQLVFGLSLHGAAGIPLVSTMFSGNTSDSKANRMHLEALGALLPEEDDVTLVADCKLVDRQTLGQLEMQQFHFVSLLPDNFDLRHALVEEVRLAQTPLAELIRTQPRTKADPQRIYRGASFDRPFTIGVNDDGPPDSNVKREVTLRFLVVESTQKEEQEEEALERRLAKAQSGYTQRLSAATRRGYGCETDARAALAKVVAKLDLHQAHLNVVAETVAVPRPRRGRPRADEPAPTAVEYRIVETRALEERAEAVAAARFHARHFVLITDHLDREAWPDARILTEYRHQHVIEGSTGFRWFKNVAEVAPVLLHTPKRIAALGVVMMLALMVRNYMQYELRRRLVETNETVPDRLDKKTQKPTTETALIPFASVTTIHVTMAGASLGRKLTGMTSEARTVLRMLKVPESVFTTPPVRKFNGGVSETPEM